MNSLIIVLKNTALWDDSNGDGVSEFYITDENGYMRHDIDVSMTYKLTIHLGPTGAWTVNRATITSKNGYNGNYDSTDCSIAVLSFAGLGLGDESITVGDSTGYHTYESNGNGTGTGTFSDPYCADAWVQNMPAIYSFDGNGNVNISYTEPSLTGGYTTRTAIGHKG